MLSEQWQVPLRNRCGGEPVRLSPAPVPRPALLSPPEPGLGGGALPLRSWGRAGRGSPTFSRATLRTHSLCPVFSEEVTDQGRREGGRREEGGQDKVKGGRRSSALGAQAAASDFEDSEGACGGPGSPWVHRGQAT